MLKRISQIQYKQRPWGTTAVQAIIKTIRKVRLAACPKNPLEMVLIKRNDQNLQLRGKAHKPPTWQEKLANKKSP